MSQDKKPPMVVCNWCNWIGEVDDLEQMQVNEETVKCCPMICHEDTPEHPANKPPFDPDGCLMDKPGLRHTISLAEKWFGYWSAINSGNFSIGNSDRRAVAKDYDELFAHGKEHGTLRHALQTLLDRAEQEDAPYSEVRALQQIISKNFD